MITFIGRVASHNETGDRVKYSVVEVRNKSDLNFRVFVPGHDLPVGSPVDVTVSLKKK